MNRDTIHLCEHSNPGLSHPCLCRRTRNHPVGKMLLHGTDAPIDPTLITLFDLTPDGEFA